MEAQQPESESGPSPSELLASQEDAEGAVEIKAVRVLRAFTSVGSGEEGKIKHSQHKIKKQNNEFYFLRSAKRARYLSMRVQKVGVAPTQRQARSVCSCLHEIRSKTFCP